MWLSIVCCVENEELEDSVLSKWIYSSPANFDFDGVHGDEDEVGRLRG